MVDRNTIEENIEAQIAGLPQKSDDELWQVVEQSLENLKEVAIELRKLTQKAKEHNNPDYDIEASKHFADLYDWYTLLRSKALGLLAERGHDVKAYLEQNAPR